MSTENDPPPGMSGTFHIDGSECTYVYQRRCDHSIHGDLAGVQFDANHNPTPTTTGDSMADTAADDLATIEMMLALNMDENSEPLSAAKRAVLEQARDDLSAPTGPSGVTDEPMTMTPNVETDLQRAIREEVARQTAQGGGQQQFAQQQQGRATTEEVLAVLQRVDPRDSETFLLLHQALVETGRLPVVGTLNGGGYLYTYQEPKGTTKAGYSPGATKGGRMVDQAVDQAKAAGAKPRKTGLCDQCWSAVEQQEDGTVVDDATKSAVCSSGGAHTFNA